ncbi:unnamed protein product, partial [Laminaria digitata]
DRRAQREQDRERRAAVAKTDAALRRDLLARQAEHKRSTIVADAERQKQEAARELEERKASDAFKELLKLEKEGETKEKRRCEVEAISQLKNAKVTAEARERSAAARDYSTGIAERRQKEEKAKVLRKEEVADRKAAMLEARERRIKERAVAAAMLRAEIESAREKAKEKEASKQKAADEHREMLRGRASKYRQDKELAKTSAFAR